MYDKNYGLRRFPGGAPPPARQDDRHAQSGRHPQQQHDQQRSHCVHHDAVDARSGQRNSGHGGLLLRLFVTLRLHATVRMDGLLVKSRFGRRTRPRATGFSQMLMDIRPRRSKHEANVCSCRHQLLPPNFFLLNAIRLHDTPLHLQQRRKPPKNVRPIT